MTSQAKTRILALIGPVTGERQAVHTENFPLDPDKMLPVADVVLLISEDNTNAMLFRYTAHGDAGGDTYHAGIAEAQVQAAEEYGDSLLPWELVPDDVGDAHNFAVRYARERLNERGWGGGDGGDGG
jgi:hypothetical protein